MPYASGKYAYFICDSCSFRYPYKTASISWDNFRVCEECFDPKHPQLETPRVGADAIALWKPRPETAMPESERGIIITTNASAGGMTFASDPIGTNFKGQEITSSLGEITVVT
tara:strand:+ start:160 stop:498 length:339 start_codon:yes stop_codon:yes gene_type:complete